MGGSHQPRLEELSHPLRLRGDCGSAERISVRSGCGPAARLATLRGSMATKNGTRPPHVRSSESNATSLPEVPDTPGRGADRRATAARILSYLRPHRGRATIAVLLTPLETALAMVPI